MKKAGIVILLSLLGYSSYSQGMYGFGIGVGRTTSYHSYFTAAVNAYHLWRITPHLYGGGELSVQRYSFSYDGNADPATVSYGDMISIRQKTSYLFFSPKIDLGIGYRKYLHVSLAGGIGIAMGPNQRTFEYVPRLATSGGNFGGDTTAVNTSYNAAKTIYRAGIGISERIPTHGYFNILLSQEFSYLAGKLTRGGTDLTSSYFCFTVGLVHKYPQVWRESD